MKSLLHIACFAALNSLFMLTTALAVSPPQSGGESLLDEVDLTWSATLQPRASFGMDEIDDSTSERLGFGVRRARFSLNANFNDSYGLFYDVDLAGAGLTTISLFGYVKPTDGLTLRFGYLPGAQPQAYIPTPMTRIDLLERAAIADMWARGTIGAAARDFGLDATLTSGNLDASLFVHTGDGAFLPQRGNFSRSVSTLSATGGAARTDMAVSTSLRLRDAGVEGLQVGGYASFNSAGNPNTAVQDVGRSYVAWSGHAYYGAAPGSQAVRLKLDVIGVAYEEIAGEDGVLVAAQNTLGFAALGALRLMTGMELLARVEQYAPDNGGGDITFLAAGLSFSPSARRGLPFQRERITLVYSSALPDGRSAHLLELQGQLSF